MPLSASNAFVLTNAEWAKPKPIYKQKESKNIRIFSLYSCSRFSFVDMSTSLTRYVLAMLELDILPFALRTSIRYEINPSFAKQTYRELAKQASYRVALATYRKSFKGFISMRDLSVKDITLNRKSVFLFTAEPLH